MPEAVSQQTGCFHESGSITISLLPS